MRKLERMKKKGAPKVWITEVLAFQQAITKRDELLREYLGIIANLVKEVEYLSDSENHQ